MTSFTMAAALRAIISERTRILLSQAKAKAEVRKAELGERRARRGRVS